MSDSAIIWAIVCVVVVLFVFNLLPVVLVALGTALGLYATGVLSLEQAMAGLGDPVVIFIAALFVVSAGLEATGVTAWAGQLLVAGAGTSRIRLLILISIAVGLLTALITPNGAVAALLPVVVVIAVRVGRSPSQLLMPFVFASHAGSMLALTGTPVNLLVTDAAVNAGVGAFGYFEFAIVGIPLLIGTTAIVVLAGESLLPDRKTRSLPADLSRHAQTLFEQYRLEEGLSQLRVRRELTGRGLDVFSRVSGLAEVMIPPRSNLIGTPAFPGMITESGDLLVLAVQRGGHDMGPGEIQLDAGDTLLLQGRWSALDEHLEDPDVLPVHSPELIRRQAVPLGQGAHTAITVLLVMVIALAAGVVPPVIAGLVAACAMVVFGVVSVEQAYRSINWTTVILVGAMIPLSTAMTQSGAAADLADVVVRIVGDAGPHALLAGFFVLTAVLGQLISNTATALIIIPVAVAAAIESDISVKPMLMSVNIAAAAALLTPVATPVNLMVMGPGGYQFGDYARLGLPVMLWFFVIAVLYVPVFWPF